MTRWNEVHASALATLESTMQQLAALKNELTTNEELKAALASIGAEPADSEGVFDDEEKDNHLENLTETLDETQGKFMEISQELQSGADGILSYL